MLALIAASAAAFISTNIDDLLILTLLYAQANTPREEHQISRGHTLGIALLTLISLLGAYGVRLLPGKVLPFLGLIPIFLGLRVLWNLRKNQHSEMPSQPVGGASGVWSIAAITIGNGADNIGVYIPLFSGFSPSALPLVFAVFFLMNLLWCRIGLKLAALPVIQKNISRCKDLAMGIVFIAIGLWVLIQ